jgi:hypothetical protein
MDAPLTGVVPVVPTIFRDGEAVDLDGTARVVDYLIDLVRQVPAVQYVKIEVPQAADKLHALASALGAGLPGPFDGEESVTLIPDLDAGASGTMASSMVPAELAPMPWRPVSRAAAAVSLCNGLKLE